MLQANCALYCRYSTKEQRPTSIEDQTRNCTQFADSRGWTILKDHIYFDKAKSGGSIAPRDGFRKMMEVAMSGKAPFEVILVDDTARVARNALDALQVAADLKSAGITVCYVSQGIDTSQQTAEELLIVHALVDSLYIKSVSSNTRRSLIGLVKNGFNGGASHYGYKSKPTCTGKKDSDGQPETEKSELEINPETAKTVIRIFSMYALEKLSPPKIAKIFNKEFMTTGSPKPSRGKFWQASTILGSKRNFRGILNNELYIGKYIYGKTTTQRTKDGKKKVIVNSPDKWVIKELPHLKIIQDFLWKAAKKRQSLTEAKIKKVNGQLKITRPKHEYAENLLTKIAKCGTCGGVFCVVSGGEYKKYGCSTNWRSKGTACKNSTKIRSTLLEEAVISTLCKELTEKESIERIAAEIHTALRERIEAILKEGRRKEEAEKELAVVRAEIDNISKSIKAGIITETTGKLLRGAEARENELENELILLNMASIDDLNIPQIITAQDLETHFKNVVRDLATPSTTRETLHSYVEKVAIKCEQGDFIGVEIHENTEKTMGYVLDLIGDRLPRMKTEKGTLLRLYTSSIFKALLILSPHKVNLPQIGETKNIFYAVGGLL